jgi:hypothetical protein
MRTDVTEVTMRASRFSLCSTLLALALGCTNSLGTDDGDGLGGKADDGTVGPQDGTIGFTRGTSEQTLTIDGQEVHVCVLFVAVGDTLKDTMQSGQKLFGLVERKSGNSCPMTSKLTSPLNRPVVFPDSSLGSLSSETIDALKAFRYRGTAYLTAQAKRDATFMEVTRGIDWQRVVGKVVSRDEQGPCVLYVEQETTGKTIGLIDDECTRTDNLPDGTRVTIATYAAPAYESDDQFEDVQTDQTRELGVEYRQVLTRVIRAHD